MFKIINIIFLIFFSITYTSKVHSKIYIDVTVDDEIITNFDIKKEVSYLTFLNPGLEKLDNKRISKLAKNSLVNEEIKKKELSKFFDLSKNHPLTDDHLKNLFLKLNYKNMEDFNQALIEKNNYSINQVKQKIKIELFWNQLIYEKYNNQVKINEEILKKRIENLNNTKQKNYLLSEIIFNISNNKSLENLKNEINLSIKEIGFNNTANIYSISETSKIGGKLGWMNENSLSPQILRKKKKLQVGDHTDTIKFGKNYLILKIDQIETSQITIDKKKELEKLIKSESNKQLNQFSRIYFDKSKINYSINEN